MVHDRWMMADGCGNTWESENDSWRSQKQDWSGAPGSLGHHAPSLRILGHVLSQAHDTNHYNPRPQLFIVYTINPQEFWSQLFSKKQHGFLLERNHNKSTTSARFECISFWKNLSVSIHITVQAVHKWLSISDEPKVSWFLGQLKPLDLFTYRRFQFTKRPKSINNEDWP